MDSNFSGKLLMTLKSRATVLNEISKSWKMIDLSYWRSFFSLAKATKGPGSSHSTILEKTCPEHKIQTTFYMKS
jgi:hypothetical protein